MLLQFLGILVVSLVSFAQIVPTTPGPGQIFKAGSTCIITWKPDSTKKWKSFSIGLKSGSNTNMSHVTDVVSGIDGTSITSYNWTCPTVRPYSAIYFYQFDQKISGSKRTNHTWTSRFTIASQNGSTSPPEYSAQPNGDHTPWGIGKLVSNHTLSNHSTPHHSQTRIHKAKITAPPPEVTLNVPLPIIKKVRRDSKTFETVHVGRPSNSESQSPRRTTGPLPRDEVKMRSRQQV